MRRRVVGAPAPRCCSFLLQARPCTQCSCALSCAHFPIRVQISESKSIVTTYRGPFNVEGIQSFLNSLGSGAVPLKVKPSSIIVSATPWDGKDGKAEAVEEFSLDEL